MLDPFHVGAALLGAGIVTVVLRAMPFWALRRLRESRLVADLGAWMPAGILVLLAVVTLVDSAGGGRLLPALLAAAMTVVVHLFLGRRALLSIAAGTGVYIALLAWW